MARKLIIMENEKHPLDDLKSDENTEKLEKWKMHTVRPGIWRETWKSRKTRNTHFRKWNMSRKTVKYGKFWNVHCRTWIMARKLKIMENEKHLLTTWKMTKSLKKAKNEKCTLKDLEYGEITENHGKWEIYTLGREMRRGKLKKVENLEMSTVWRGIW